MRNPAITVVTSTRAEFGLLRPVVAKLCQNGPAPGAGWPPARTCARGWGAPWPRSKPTPSPRPAWPRGCPFFPKRTPASRSRAPSRAPVGVFDAYFAAHRPDALVLLGDRFEIFAVAVAAAARPCPHRPYLGRGRDPGRGG